MPCRPAALGQEGHITQPHDFHEGWQAVVLNAGELASYSSEAFCAHTIVHVYSCFIAFSSCCVLSIDAAVKLSADSECIHIVQQSTCCHVWLDAVIPAK